MAAFLYVAVDAGGRERKGVLEGDTARHVRQLLREQALLPVSVLEQGGPEADPALARDWLRPAADAHKNYGYAAQWWGLALLIVGLYVWYQVVRPRLRRQAR